MTEIGFQQFSTSSTSLTTVTAASHSFFLWRTLMHGVSCMAHFHKFPFSPKDVKQLTSFGHMRSAARRHPGDVFRGNPANKVARVNNFFRAMSSFATEFF